MSMGFYLNNEICYWCGSPATSKEHIPPKCLFPEDKDLIMYFKKSFRKNLIKIPSCDLHNSRKSKDDEYLLISLASLFGNNEIAFFHAYTKVIRTYIHNPKLVPVGKNYTLNKNNMKLPITAVEVNLVRLRKSFEGIARGLFFYENDKIFSGIFTQISTLFLIKTNIDENAKYTNSYINKSLEILKNEQKNWNTQIKGDNPEIFTYQFSSIDPYGTQTVYIKFFEKTELFCIFAYEEKIDKYPNKEFITKLLLDENIKVLFN